MDPRAHLGFGCFGSETDHGFVRFPAEDIQESVGPNETRKTYRRYSKWFWSSDTALLVSA